MAAAVVKFTKKGSDLVTAALCSSNINYLWWGTGVTPATVDDTDPETEGAEARTVGVQSQYTTDHTHDTYQVIGEITSLSSQDITEAGIANASSAGDSAVRATFDSMHVYENDKIEFTFRVKHDHS